MQSLEEENGSFPLNYPGRQTSEGHKAALSRRKEQRGEGAGARY